MDNSWVDKRVHCTYIVSNDLHRCGKVLLHRKRSRRDIETCFRDTKQLAGLGVCQCRVPQVMERHVALVLLTFVVLCWRGSTHQRQWVR